MSRLERDEVERLARLARLALDEADLERLSVQMASILRHFEELDAAGALGAPRIQERGLGERTRQDRPDADPLRFGPERNAPDWRDGFFVVPSLKALAGPGEEP